MRTFEELRGPAETWCTSLAYWVGVHRGNPTTREILGLAGELSLQYDVEDQADAYGSVMPEQATWPRVFSPVAPIQLARAWSPVPRTVQLLGPPRDEAIAGETGIRTIAVAWSLPADVKPIARRLRGQRTTAPDERRLLELLAAVVLRASQRSGDVVLIARPGWSYEHAHPASPRTASLMTRAGFVVTDRTAGADR